MNNICKLLIGMMAAVCCTSCNNEWEDEQFKQLASFKAEINNEGVTSTYVRYKPGGVVTYQLPVLLSGSTMNTQTRTIHVALDKDTLDVLNQERFGERRRELFYHLLDQQYYSIPETVEMPAGESEALLPIDFTLGGQNNAKPLDMSDKYILPLTIQDDPSYNYQVNNRLHYRKALLNIIPFNDYSGSYDGSLLKIFLENQKDNFMLATHKAYVYDEKTIMLYMGVRDVNYMDRKYYKLYVEFTDEPLNEGSELKKKLRLWTDNGGEDGNNLKILLLGEGDDKFKEAPYYTIVEENDPVKPYLKHIYITLSMGYSFEDYTLSPGNRMKYRVEGTLSMQRDLNTLIPDEDQQIEWN